MTWVQKVPIDKKQGHPLFKKYTRLYSTITHNLVCACQAAHCNYVQMTSIKYGRRDFKWIMDLAVITVSIPVLIQF